MSDKSETKGFNVVSPLAAFQLDNWLDVNLQFLRLQSFRIFGKESNDFEIDKHGFQKCSSSHCFVDVAALTIRPSSASLGEYVPVDEISIIF